MFDSCKIVKSIAFSDSGRIILVSTIIFGSFGGLVSQNISNFLKKIAETCQICFRGANAHYKFNLPTLCPLQGRLLLALSS